MRFLSKTKKSVGWLAINIQEDGLYAAHVTRPPAARPQVGLVAFFRTDKAAAGLEKMAKACHADSYACTNLLNPGEYRLLSVDAPMVPQGELKAAIRWRLKDMLDFHIDDATIDVLDVPGDQNAPERKSSMYAVAAPEQFIKQRQELFEQTAIPLSVIDIPEMAQRNISALLEPTDRGLALLSFDAKGGLLTISFGGELYLTRRFDVTLGQLSQMQAEQRLAKYERITLELQRSFDHFDRQYQFITLAKLVLAPMGDAGASLHQHLSSNLYMPVEAMTLEDVLDISGVAALRAAEQQQLYFMVLGAALRQEVTEL